MEANGRRRMRTRRETTGKKKSTRSGVKTESEMVIRWWTAWHRESWRDKPGVSLGGGERRTGRRCSLRLRRLREVSGLWAEEVGYK